MKSAQAIRGDAALRATERVQTFVGRGLHAWFAERFPLKNVFFFAVLYATTLLVSRALTRSNVVVLTWRDAFGVIGVVAFFLCLRVLDEHKDYEGDQTAHPDRVLQRGVVSLSQLRLVGALALVAQLGFVLIADNRLGRVTLWWVIVALWTALMSVEFFAAEYLRSRLVLYAALHMLVMPLVMLWIAQVGAGAVALPGAVWPLAALGFTSGAAFEVGRKLRAPADERPGVETYTKALGIPNAALVVLVCTALSAILAGILIASLAPGPPAAVLDMLLVLDFGAAAGKAGRFVRTPSADTAARANDGVAVAHMVVFGTLLVAVIAARGVAWV